jgi:parallel beta-helix repeat protein
MSRKSLKEKIMRFLRYSEAGIFAMAALLLTARCTINPANTSEVGNPGLTGHLIDGRTGAPADGAVVRLYQVYLNKMAKALGKAASGAPAIDSTRCDHAGAYRFDSLDQGIYSIEGEKIDGADTLTMRHPSVVIIRSKDLGCDTLRLPGSIKGKVVVPGGESPKNITCYLPGTSYIAITNDTGGFRITGIPAGTYSLSITSALFNDTTLNGITVTPDKEADIGYIAIGLDRGKNEHDVWGVFDTMYDCKAIDSIEARVSGDSIPADKPRIYKLDWRRSLNGYSGFILVPDNGFFWTIDIWVFDTLGRRIGAYRVPTINRATGDVEVPQFNPRNGVPVITLHDTTVSINDTVLLRPVITKLSDDSIVSMEWKIGSGGTFVASTKKDTLIVAPKDSAEIVCCFRVTDKFGNSVIDSTVVTVIKDVPIIDIGYDTIVPVGTTVTFSSTHTQQFGFIVMYKWNFQGDGVWDDSGSKDSVVKHTFSDRGKHIIRCSVQDDDGNTGSDSLLLLVGQPLSGELSGDSTLSAEKSPYFIQNSLIVLEGNTLRINPGVEIRFTANSQLKIEGSLSAIGEKGKRIIFAASDTAKGWGGINSSGASLILKCCDVISANSTIDGAIRAFEGPQSGKIAIDSCLIIHAGNAINLYSNATTVSITNTVMNDCGQNGIFAANSSNSEYDSIIIQNNLIDSSTGIGIKIWGSGRAIVRNNTITRHTVGVQIVWTDGELIIHKNVITENIEGVTCSIDGLDSNNIFSNTAHNAVAFQGVDWNIPLNWWGTTDTAAIHATIQDRKDDPNLGNAFFTPVLTAPVPDAGCQQ